MSNNGNVERNKERDLVVVGDMTAMTMTKETLEKRMLEGSRRCAVGEESEKMRETFHCYVSSRWCEGND